MFSITIDSFAFVFYCKGDFGIQKWKSKKYDVNQQLIYENIEVQLWSLTFCYQYFLIQNSHFVLNRATQLI